jgi:hypothetical protein
VNQLKALGYLCSWKFLNAQVFFLEAEIPPISVPFCPAVDEHAENASEYHAMPYIDKRPGSLICIQKRRRKSRPEWRMDAVILRFVITRG